MTAAVLVALVLSTAIARWLLADLRAVPSGAADTPAGGAPRVAVVVPARDEEATLPALLASLDAGGAGSFAEVAEVAEVIVVDDGSRDATAAVARSAGATVLVAPPPPPGWTGKAWACHVGARSTQAELLLFLDADTVLAPGALDGLLALHARHGGLVSVQPFHRVERAYEQLSAYFNAMSLLASAVFARRPATRPMAFGPCLLTSRTDYERAGGHEAVRGEILDDVRLAAAYARAGLPVRCAVGGASIWMRSYPGGLRQLVDGWTKNFASGASTAAPGPSLAAGLWIGVHHAVALGAALVLVEAATGWGTAVTAGEPVGWALAWAVVAWQLRSVLRRIGSFRWWVWAFFPLALVAFDLIFARSVALTVVRRSVRWRGREVRVSGRGPRSSTPSSRPVPGETT